MYHVTLCCAYFKELRGKYIKPYYHERPNMNIFVELIKTRNKHEIHTIMLFTKFAFKNTWTHYYNKLLYPFVHDP